MRFGVPCSRNGGNIRKLTLPFAGALEMSPESRPRREILSMQRRSPTQSLGRMFASFRQASVFRDKLSRFRLPSPQQLPWALLLPRALALKSSFQKYTTGHSKAHWYVPTYPYCLVNLELFLIYSGFPTNWNCYNTDARAFQCSHQLCS